jgi:pSer/pThr/pTyr-binding forkhead associated (FHA) protein
MAEYFDVVFDIFDETGQRASVRTDLTVGHIIEAVLLEFEGLDGQAPARYALYKGTDPRPLERHKTLPDQGVQPGDRLTFGWTRDPLRQLRRPLAARGRLSLLEASTQVAFPIEWQPAIIGRPDADAAHNELLAADLQWLEGSRQVSRRHARITEREGQYYIEPLADRNPTLLNGRRLSFGRPEPLRAGDIIGLGGSGIRLEVIIEG